MHEDPSLRRLVRTAVVLCLLMTVAALPLAGAGGAIAVLGGGLLVALSYLALANVTRVLMAGEGPPDARRARAVRGAVLRFVSRYVLLGFLAYVMIARLRLPPLGLLAGASSFAAAAFVEAVRLLAKKST